MKFVRLVFVVTFLISFSSAAAFSENGNASSGVETLMLNGYEKSGESYSLLFDDSSPGIQDGNDVGFVKAGPVNLTLNELAFELCSPACSYQKFVICYDATRTHENSGNPCLASQCVFDISKLSYWGAQLAENGCIKYKISVSAEACMPKIENEMIQMKVIHFSCPVKAKDSRIKYPEIPSTTVRSPQQSGQNPDAASASLWYNSWWFILIAVCVVVALILGGAAASLVYCLKKKRNSVKAPPPPPSIIAADKKTVTMGQQPSVVMPNAEVVQKKKKKNNGKAEKKAAAPPKAKTPPLSGKNPYGGDDTQDYLDLVKSKSYSSKSI